MIMVIIAGGAVLIVAASVAVVGTVALKSRRSGRGRAPASRVGQGLIHAATALLPGEVGARYGEEWSGELIALQDEGAGRSALARYVTGILLKAVPVLAISLRLHRSRAVE
jgi:hypothetical protein